MENTLRLVYIFNDTVGITEFKILADSVEQKNGWILAIWRNKVTCGVKEEHLKAFYLELVN